MSKFLRVHTCSIPFYWLNSYIIFYSYISSLFCSLVINYLNVTMLLQFSHADFFYPWSSVSQTSFIPFIFYSLSLRCFEATDCNVVFLSIWPNLLHSLIIIINLLRVYLLGTTCGWHNTPPAIVLAKWLTDILDVSIMTPRYINQLKRSKNFSSTQVLITVLLRVIELTILACVAVFFVLIL